MPSYDFQEIRRFIERNREAIVRDISRLVAILSVEEAPAADAPYGKGPRAALEEALCIARELGLETGDCMGRMGWAEVCGAQSDVLLSTITHVDVVPAGSGWDGDPFTLKEREGYLIGRGVIDDKGPTVLCLYALCFLKEQGLPLRYPVRALIGTSEETGMDDIGYYLSENPAPAFCFSPDAEFPLCNGEKGIFQGRFLAREDTADSGDILELAGGTAINAVCAHASALIRSSRIEWPQEADVAVRPEGDFWRIEAHGIGGHASLPQNTKSAIGILIAYLLKTDVGIERERAFLTLASRLHAAWDGSALGIAADDGKFPPLTIVGGMIGMENGRLFQTFDCRYPTNTSAENLTRMLSVQAGETASVEVITDAPPFYIEADHPAIMACLDSYREVTGEDPKPFTIGGGTYARKFPLAVSFGPERTSRPRPPFAGAMHSANEAACLDELLEALEIYIRTLLRLQQLDPKDFLKE